MVWFQLAYQCIGTSPRRLRMVWMLMVLCCNARRDGTLGLTLDPQLIRDLTVLITSSTVRILMPYHTLLVLSA